MGWNMCKHVTHLVHQLATTTTTTTEAATTATTRTLVARRVTPPPPPPPTGRAGLPKESVNNIFHKFNWQQAGLAGRLEGRWGDDRSPGRIKGAAGEGGVGRGGGGGGTTTIERTRAITINDRYLPQQESTGKRGRRGQGGEGRGSRQRAGYTLGKRCRKSLLRFRIVAGRQ